MNEKPRADRYHIAIFGRRNVGKSSLLNTLIGQEVSIVSAVAGTTTDTVWKSVELPDIGAAVIGDTAGFDDEGMLGKMRVEATRKVLSRIDLAILLLGENSSDSAFEREWHAMLLGMNVPVVLVVAKGDLPGHNELCREWEKVMGCDVLSYSSVTGEGRMSLLGRTAKYYKADSNIDDITHSLVKPGDMVVLVMPQDKQAPKGRLIQPQVLTLRNLLDKHCIPLCCAPEELPALLGGLKKRPKLVITDSQVFSQVESIIPRDVMLTSFSILMARYKGDVETFCEGAKALSKIPANGKVLIAEACSHIPQNEDIGRVKLPRLLRKCLGDNLVIDIVSGNDFPENLESYDVVIHCGACMFNRRMVMSRVRQAKAQGVPITNYGIAIAVLTGIMDRVVV